MKSKSFFLFLGLATLILGACQSSSVCGDGKLDTTLEECDDGNTVDGDGCSSTCQTEVPLPVSTCGNKVKETGEACDDGNKTSGDGCSSTCKKEVLVTCGDGHKDLSEQCDDGNLINGDGCDDHCRISTVTVQCAVLAPLDAGTTCEVTAGNATRLLVGTVLAPDKIYEGGQVAVDDLGVIQCVGCDCSAQAVGATKISCPTGVISPGLINAHDHLTYSQNSPYTDTGERYEHRHEWRKGLNGHTQIPAPGGATTAQVQWGELRFLMGGATSTVGSGSAAGLLRNLDRSDQEGLGQKAIRYETFPLGDSDGTLQTSGCMYGSINTEFSILTEDAYFAHVAEGISAAARNEFLCLSSSSNGGQNLVQPQSAFIHSVALNAADYKLMAKSGTALVWSPRSNITIYGNTAEVTEAARLGVEIALGTDWIPTGSMNVLRELRCADNLNQNYYDKYFSDEDLWRMVTVNAASAAADNDVIGSLTQGKVADISIFDGRVNKGYRAIVAASSPDVALVMRGGHALYGDANIITSIGSGTCDALTVCGSDKKVCLSADIGMDYATLNSTAASPYPAFFCGVPDHEPSCTPTRPAAVNKSTIYTGLIKPGDIDGDGIPDATDNCPHVFNPIRPLDNGHQADADGDGQGDVCDVCPFDANTEVCATFDPTDTDGDGVENNSDNCPIIANSNQLDADGDGKGDACDACPASANPGLMACPATIYDIKKGMVAVGTAVSISPAIVTEQNSKGYFLQVSPSDASYSGTSYSGVFVFDSMNSVNVGDKIALSSALVANFQGQIQLTNAVRVATVQTEALPAPTVVMPSDVATGGSRAAEYEGVLVSVEDVIATDVAPEVGTGDTAPTNEFVVTGGLRVNDLFYLISPFPLKGVGYLKLTGILEFRNGNSKLELRSGADVTLGAPVLVDISPATAFIRNGATGPTIPNAIVVHMSGPTLVATPVSITSSDPSSLMVLGGGVTVPASQSSAVVQLGGLAQSTGVTLTASSGSNMATATVRVVDDAEIPRLVSLTPAMPMTNAGHTVRFTVALDLPAAVGGTDVALALTPANAGTIPTQVTIPGDQTEATFDYVDGNTVLACRVDAALSTDVFSASVSIVPAGGGLIINEIDYDNVGTDDAEFIELYNSSAASIDLTSYQVVLVNGTDNSVYMTIPLSGTLGAFGYLVITSNTGLAINGATRVAFVGSSLTNNIQNGPPDGVALIRTSDHALIDALSYEGSITMANIPNMPNTNLVEGTVLPTSVADSTTIQGSLCRIPNGSDSNNAATDWKFCSAPTPGAANGL